MQAASGVEYWMQMIKCRDACPVHTDACGYVTAIGEGRYEDAYRMARATNPFASICGRVCGAPCEVNCRRGSLDAPITIRALKRFATDRFGPEAAAQSLHAQACDERMLPPGRGNGERIAVVGGGVSGLTVAHDLTRIGYKVTVFEADAEPGGMLMVGVPVFRLPRDLVRQEIQAILDLGVELQCNKRLGRDFTIGDLRKQGFRAVFLGIGLPKGRKLAIPGSDHPNVYDGMEFLRAFNQGNPLALGKKVVVIGGGNVAYDVARSAIRPVLATTHSEAVDDLGRGERLAYDVARSALRMSADKEVHVVCLESRAEMPADEIEIEEAAEEGIHLHNSQGPKEVISSNGTVKALRTIRCTSVFDENGRFSPKFDEAAVTEIPADTILFAIGQSADLSFLDPADGVQSNRGLIQVNPETYQTTAPDVFACGDIAHGARLFIDAIASAQIAARSMHDFLRGTRTEVAVRSHWSPAQYAMAEGWERMPRENPQALDAHERSGSLQIIEQPFTEEDARRQASRCLRCNVNTVFETNICIACTGCVDVCPENLIQLAGFSRLRGDQQWMEFAAGSLGIKAEQLAAMSDDELDQLGGVMLKDETTCIRCSLCASRCPTHAITMKRFDYYRECVSVSSLNPKVQYAATGPKGGSV